MPQNTRRYFDEAQDLIKGKSPEDYGPEFAGLMRAKIGERFKHLVTPEKLGLMALVGRPEDRFTLRGVNFPTGLDSPENIKEMENYLRPALKSYYYDSKGHFQDWNQKLPKGKRIFGTGAGANAITYAHELRHEDVEDEKQNRMFDLINSSTLPAYKANIENSFNYITRFDKSLSKNTSLADKEKEVIQHFAPRLLDRRHVEDTNMGDWDRLRGGDLTDAISKNIELNKKGAVGAFIGQEQLPQHVINYRSNFPFLNFVGRLDEYGSTKKAAGGAIENTTHYRKMI
jgi:hypothetical protein